MTAARIARETLSLTIQQSLYNTKHNQGELTMSTCKTCKFWVKGEPFGKCDQINWHDEQYPRLTMNDTFCLRAEASDDTGLECDLLTKETFGCNMHKES